MNENDPAYVVYIDEAGDPGVETKADTSDQALEWFTLGAVVVDVRRDQDVVDWTRDMREAVRAQSLLSPLHYRKLSQSNQRRVCRMLSTKPVRLFAVATHKTNMRGHQNKRMGKPLGRGEFYNWCIRLLLERVSSWCARRSKKDFGEVRPIKIFFFRTWRPRLRTFICISSASRRTDITGRLGAKGKTHRSRHSSTRAVHS